MSNIPGKSGSTFLKRASPARDDPAPIFMISGQGDIALAVQSDQERRAGLNRKSQSAEAKNRSRAG